MIYRALELGEKNWSYKMRQVNKRRKIADVIGEGVYQLTGTARNHTKRLKRNDEVERM